MTTKHRVYHQGDAAPVTPEVVFGDVEQITIGQLRVGDFLCTVPTQGQLRGVRFDSTVTDLQADITWFEQWRRRGPKMPIEARSLRTRAMGATGRYSYPSRFTCTVRRPQS
jgi:hypothetical protein